MRQARVVIGVPALGLWTAAVSVLDGSYALDEWPGSSAATVPLDIVEPGGALLLFIVAAALTSGAGRPAAVVVVEAQIAVTAHSSQRGGVAAPT